MALRLAFEFACCSQWKNAVDKISNAANNEPDEKNRAYLMQIKAEYTNFYDKLKAQQILQSARRLSGGVLIPMEGIQYDKLLNNREQVKGVREYFVNISDNPNECIIHINSVLDMLSFSPDANEFESALMETGKILGFESSRPDKMTSGKGPDNLWAIGDNKYLVIECKSGAVCETISKDYCNQLGGSERWFKAEYGNGYQCVPVIVHPSTVLDSLATQVQGMKIITSELLDKMKKQIKDFSAALVQNMDLQDEDKINALLALYKLRGRDIVNEYMTNITR